MPLTLDDVAHIASLVRIGMTEAELETFRADLTNILGQFDLLSAVDTSGVPATAHPFDMNNTFNDDAPTSSLDPDAVLANAPQREGDYFRVKPVLEE